LAKSGVGVEKVHFPQNSQNLGDRKCLGKLRKSFVGLPDAILFLRILRERVFQHPQAITRFDRWSLSEMAILRQLRLIDRLEQRSVR
jgi:hypothetical protein